MSKTDRIKKRLKKAAQLKQSVEIPPPPGKKKFKLVAFIVTLIAILSGIVTIIAFPIRGCFLTPKQKWEEENTKQGDVKSSKISETYTPIKVSPNFNYDTTLNFPEVKGIYIKGLKEKKFLSILIGHTIFLCPVISLYEGIEILNPRFRNCSNSTLALAAKDDRLYVSAKFIALSNENGMIGDMEFNHWKIYNGAYRDYSYDDDRFEVKDKQGRIVFSILYSTDKNQSFVSISGYFVSPTSVLVLNKNEDAFTIHGPNDVRPQDCIQKSDSNWKQNAEIEIAKIKSTFK